MCGTILPSFSLLVLYVSRHRSVLFLHLQLNQDMADPRIKKLKIHTGVVKRITKEKEMYEKEAVQIEGKLEKLKADGVDEHDIKKQQEVLQESKQMVPDTLKRLKTAYDELKNLVLDGQADLGETEELKAAQVALEAAAKLVDCK